MSSKYRSDTPFKFAEEHRNLIVRTISYIDYRHSVISFSRTEHTNVSQSISTAFPRLSRVGFGVLGRIPLELVIKILTYLDIRSIFAIRQLNLKFRQIIQSLKQFRVVVLHGLDLLCASLRTGIAFDVTLWDFYDLLCTKNCGICGAFGAYVSLLTWKRCCFKCMRKAPEIQMLSLTRLQKAFDLTKAQTRQLKSFKSLPGKYLWDDLVTSNRRIAIASVQQAALISSNAPSFIIGRSNHDKKFNFMGACALPYYDKRTEQVECGLLCSGCELAIDKSIIGRRGEDWAQEARQKEYTRDGLLEHFQWCEQAQILWSSSDEGSRKPKELTERARRGSCWTVVSN
ncbi:hypothetical protein BT69DRAFT_1307366 [Atractiella rhizophila]|nr:hypothetical protein BT69DRAFT_1307366 [Atractiella rhizophila]